MPIGWEITVVVLCVAVAALAVVVLGLLRQVTPVLERAASASGQPQLSMGPAKGSPLPDFTAAGAHGAVTGTHLRGRSAVLLFLAPGCGPCQDLAYEMRSADLGHLAGQLVIITGPDDAQALGIPAHLLVLTEHDRQVSDALSVNGTPFAIAVDPDGIVRDTRVPNTITQLQDLAGVLA
ncbi:MAG TPA: hypothetical protein VKU39_21550 [Streptosporangiaceae bacterium]|nr:hypothetical protein [Streptosporangiaceae bacterium]